MSALGIPQIAVVHGISVAGRFLLLIFIKNVVLNVAIGHREN